MGSCYSLRPQGLGCVAWGCCRNLRVDSTWTPKVCRIMAFWASFKCFGLFVYLLFGVKEGIWVQSWCGTIRPKDCGTKGAGRCTDP